MLRPAIPVDPVDGYELSWWAPVYPCSRPVLHRAIYHVNTPWSAFSDSPGGAPLTDDWQVLVDGDFRYRIGAWRGIDADWDLRFSDEESARAAFRLILARRVDDARRRLIEAEAELARESAPRSDTPDSP